MMLGVLVAFALQALPSATAQWRDVTAPGDETSTWVDTTSIRGPRTHAEAVLRLANKSTNGYGYMSVVLDCMERTITVVAIRSVDTNGKVTFDRQYTSGEVPPGSFKKDDNGFAGYICNLPAQPASFSPS